MRRWIWLLMPFGGLLSVFAALGAFLVILIIPIAFFLAPFEGGNIPPAGITTITNVYLPLEKAAVQKYERCTEVPIYQGAGTKRKIVGHRRVCRGVTVPFVQAIMRAESDGWALAVSKVGALGLMQVTVGKVTGDMENGKSPFDPKVNIMRGVEYLDTVYFGVGESLPMTAAGYNAGEGKAQAWIAEYRTNDWSVISANPAVQRFAQGQTYNYVDNVMRYYAEFNSGQCSPSSIKLGKCN